MSIQSLSHVQLFASPWTINPKSPLFMGFSWQEYFKWVAISYSTVSSQPRDGTCISWVSCTAGTFFTTKPPGKEKVKLLSCIRLFVTPWTIDYQASLSMAFSRQDYWSGLPYPSPGDLPDPGIKPGPTALQADTLPSEPPGKPPSHQGSPL